MKIRSPNLQAGVDRKPQHNDHSYLICGDGWEGVPLMTPTHTHTGGYDELASCV